jgi:hypothetical protein
MSIPVNIPVNLASGTVKLIAYQAGQPLNGSTPEAWNDAHYASYAIVATLAGGNAVGSVPDNADTVDARLYAASPNDPILNQGKISDFSVDTRVELAVIGGNVSTINTKLGTPVTSVAADIAAMPTALLGVTIDGVQFLKLVTAWKAFMNGKCVITNLGAGLHRADFYAADNSTIVFTCTFTASSGARSSGGTFP